jgi:Protein of unknown function (DUF3352)
MPRLVRRPIPAILLACVAIAAALIAGCGGGGGGGGSADVGPAAAAPATAPIYVDATVEPTGSAESDAKAALSKVMDTDDPGGKLVSLIEQSAKSDGHPINFQQDVEPWLGEKVGFFFTNLSGDTQQGAAVVETKDPEAALAFARKVSGATATNPAPKTYNGVSYQADPTDPTSTVFGIVGDFLVQGDETGFKAAVDAQKGDSLGDDGDFKDAIGDLPDDRLGTLYTVPKTLIESIGPDQIDPSGKALLEKTAGDSLEKPIAGALTATADSFDLDLVGGNSGSDTPESALIGDVPADSWLAIGAGDLGGVAKQTLDQVKDQIPNFDAVVQQIEATTGSSLDDLTSSLGDAVLYVEGVTQPTLTGALVVQTKNPDLTGRLVTQLQGLLQLGTTGIRPLKLSGGGTGFQINDPGLAPAPVEIAQENDQLVIGYGANSAERTLEPAQTLGDSPLFSSAKGQVSDLGTDLFLDMPKIFQLVEATSGKSDPSFAQAKPYIDALTYLITGSGSKDDQTEVKAVLGLK